jgi:hypothetical protein
VLEYPEWCCRVSVLRGAAAAGAKVLRWNTGTPISGLASNRNFVGSGTAGTPFLAILVSALCERGRSFAKRTACYVLNQKYASNWSGDVSATALTLLVTRLELHARTAAACLPVHRELVVPLHGESSKGSKIKLCKQVQVMNLCFDRVSNSIPTRPVGHAVGAQLRQGLEGSRCEHLGRNCKKMHSINASCMAHESRHTKWKSRGLNGTAPVGNVHSSFQI